ncbi:MAG: flotillin family protein [Okeania sp. SIO2F4]|uniref:flotillin family protein n=1 Tax=Okeania sp. SIO2F4 TaxID=2607790 RepID=UPI001428F201|nr:flotillin family protein [Okeania sp. SIO2F4]NES04330.1 flotillin family protein [Okeania sp. SIO2F4]
MLFWLTFLESLPSISSQEIITKEVQPKPKEIVLSENICIQPTLAQFSQNNSTFLLGGTAAGIVGIIFLLLLGFWAYTRVYQITPNNEAFVRTGGFLAKKNSVILYGGCIVLPGFHELTRVPMREISIDVERTGNLAVRTKDYLRANMRVTFYVCINADQQDVKTAASRLSKQGRISPEDIKDALEKRADDAIRAAAKKKTLAEIDSDKLGFADEVFNLIQPDLKKVGLTLNNIAISEIEESDTYDTNNFFDAQGVKLRTETIQKSIKQKQEVELITQQERRELELNTQIAIRQKELTARKQALEIEKEQETALLEQQLELESLRAQRAREIQEAKDIEAANEQRNQILQTKAIEEEEIKKKLAVQQSQIEADIALEEQHKKLKVTQALQKQESEMAEITRQQMVDSNRLKAQVEVAEAERLSKIAQQEAAIAIAEKEQQRLISEAEKAKAESGVTTAAEIEKAERQQKLSIIVAEQEAEKHRISEQNVVEIDVFRRKRQAEIAREAADLEAESLKTLAAANRDKDLAEAEGIEAKVEAENAMSDANRIAQIFTELGPSFIDRLPEIVKALAPQPGILGDAKIYAFPSANGNNGNGAQDISKLMLSTSGLTLINSLLDEGKLENLITKVTQLIISSNGSISKPVESSLDAIQATTEKSEIETAIAPQNPPLNN